MVKDKKTEHKELDVSKFVSDLIAEYRNKDITVDNGKVGCSFIDTGNLALNYIMSGSFDYGLPEGQVTEIHGDPSTGKSLLLYNIISNFQKKYPSGVVILDDTENAYVEYLGSTLEIDENRLIKLSSSTVEEHANVIALGGKVPIRKGDKFEEIDIGVPLLTKLLKSGIDKILVAVDSIAVLSTKHEFDVGLDKPDMSKAKTLKALLRLMTPIIKKHNVTYIVTNHLIFVIGSLIPNMKVTPGGGGVVYQSSVRLGLSPAGKLKMKNTNTVTGVISKVTTVKNRFAPPFRTCKLEIMFNKGMSRYSGLISLLTNLGVIKLGNGGWYEVLGREMKFQSKELPEIWEKLREVISSKDILQREGEDVISQEADEDKSLSI